MHTLSIRRVDQTLRFITYGGFCCLRVRDVVLKPISIAASLAPEDPEIAFNLAAVLEACKSDGPERLPNLISLLGGRLEDALTYYKLSKENGVDRAEMHMRNVSAAPITLDPALQLLCRSAPRS